MVKDENVVNQELLVVKDLFVSMSSDSGKEIIKNVSFNVNKGETVVIIGPNGSGKSTIAKALTGFPGLNIKGDVIFNDEILFDLSPTERSRKGLFMSFQSPVEIQGVTLSNFLRTAINARRPKDNKINLRDFVSLLNEAMASLNIPKEFAHRDLNHGLSGGEKKKAEMLQLFMLNPVLAILDETDSGLDVDALKEVCLGINKLKELNPDLGLIVITHYKRMLDYLNPDKVLVLVNGEIKKRGGEELVHLIEEKGFEVFK
ncbi:Fe-S cluster assembly ATPase SufC [Candidatus Woesearchaeota archaeon]|jgi:Fe-S cluster assembly ATP-binding protein|nr:Fe-S cluster assembly ATPase SufC [Candidatus Woesearchaeota archaeon]